MRIRETAVAVTVGLACLAGPTMVTVAPASADAVKVEKAEYQQVKPGWKINRVHQLFGIKGRKVYQGDGEAIRTYQGWAQCIRVDVTYRHTDAWRVESKRAWVDTDCVP